MQGASPVHFRFRTPQSFVSSFATLTTVASLYILFLESMLLNWMINLHFWIRFCENPRIFGPITRPSSGVVLLVTTKPSGLLTLVSWQQRVVDGGDVQSCVSVEHWSGLLYFYSFSVLSWPEAIVSCQDSVLISVQCVASFLKVFSYRCGVRPLEFLVFLYSYSKCPCCLSDVGLSTGAF